MRRAAILTISDKGFKGEREDLSGPMLREILGKAGFSVAKTDQTISNCWNNDSAILPTNLASTW
jgi:molybdopterin biosynthesis enzyme MoaB